MFAIPAPSPPTNTPGIQTKFTHIPAGMHLGQGCGNLRPQLTHNDRSIIIEAYIFSYHCNW